MQYLVTLIENAIIRQCSLKKSTTNKTNKFTNILTLPSPYPTTSIWSHKNYFSSLLSKSI